MRSPNVYLGSVMCLKAAVFFVVLGATSIHAAEPASNGLGLSAPILQVISKDSNFPLNISLGMGDHTSVEAHAGQIFAVTAQYPIDLASKEVIVDALDGGKIDGQTYRKLKIGVTGLLSFEFTAGQNLGGYQIELRGNGNTASLCFAVEAAQLKP